MKKYIITVIVEHVYEKEITAKSLKEAERKADFLNIQDDEENYLATETMEPTVEETDEE